MSAREIVLLVLHSYFYLHTFWQIMVNSGSYWFWILKLSFKKMIISFLNIFGKKKCMTSSSQMQADDFVCATDLQ